MFDLVLFYPFGDMPFDGGQYGARARFRQLIYLILNVAHELGLPAVS
jgi:hypothetical protein